MDAFRPTPEELKEILAEAEELSGYISEDPITFGHSDWKSVIFLSKKQKLIFIQGNDEIGFTHIRKRHRDYWANSELKAEAFKEDGTIKTPSHSHPEFSSLFDYAAIADEIFSTTVTGNKEGCDSCEGFFTHSDGKKIKYRLILLEGTKLVISLFPLTEKSNIKKPKDFLWHRAKVKTTDYIDSSGQRIIQVWVPYYNAEFKVQYSIFVKYFMPQLLEQVFIYVHNDKGRPETPITNQHKSPIIAERTVPEVPDCQILEMMYQNGEMSGFEKIILDIHNRRPNTD